MKITLADKFIAYLALLSGLTISAVAIWYSVAGLVSIFSASVVPIIVMGVVLEVSKLIATIWLKINWSRAPIFIRTYLLLAIAILMIITSMGIFGFLSKAHSDAGLVSGDVQAKIAVYDEKIKTERENIEASRKALKQMDETIDQTIARSKTDQGAVNANNMRQRQAKERAQIQSDIAKSQKTIAALNNERAPIAAEVRKVEAEVGPIKYIAAFIYDDKPDANLLEKAVTWVIIIIVSVFDPLAVILLLASQYSFQWFRRAREEEELATTDQVPLVDAPQHKADVEPLPTNQIAQPTEPASPPHRPETHPYLSAGFGSGFQDLKPMVHRREPIIGPLDKTVEPEEVDKKIKDDFDSGNIENIPWETVEQIEEQKATDISDFPTNPYKGQTFIDPDGKNFIFNGVDWINSDWSDKNAVKDLVNIGEESKKKINYMIKEQEQQVLKTRE
jgi:hypothetical protein